MNIIDNNLRICRFLNYCKQFSHYLVHGPRYLLKVWQLSSGSYKKQMYRTAFRHSRYYRPLAGTPCLGQQPAYTVPVYRFSELFFGYRKARHQRIGGRPAAGGCIMNKIYYSEGKNRKRFPCTEKRSNMLLFFEPLIYL